MPKIDASTWTAEAIAEQTERLQRAGAQPRVEIAWLSAAERQQAALDAADEAYCATLRNAALKGGTPAYGSRSRGY